ncbi:hypothetical protein CEUSTIGMA_g11226.t1 [Chlamydomonas eustigma]|uniref:Uncharacterized protein n=1 Tax=Chlamydomonas eustigma TaxID=1157962 RepID=A0A250XL19_9CHLO|nr:hypothetical protein CEUSTIGMA_g11226.t1 [Chlamydomonas eustigma]|eukprot:GAX83801.1 hypothetical protein CEUSTIGMA_g11226.t1 [Chlamydomonas eustigma]
MMTIAKKGYIRGDSVRHMLCIGISMYTYEATEDCMVDEDMDSLILTQWKFKTGPGTDCHNSVLLRDKSVWECPVFWTFCYLLTSNFMDVHGSGGEPRGLGHITLSKIKDLWDEYFNKKCYNPDEKTVSSADADRMTEGMLESYVHLFPKVFFQYLPFLYQNNPDHPLFLELPFFTKPISVQGENYMNTAGRLSSELQLYSYHLTCMVTTGIQGMAAHMAKLSSQVQMSTQIAAGARIITGEDAELQLTMPPPNVSSSRGAPSQQREKELKYSLKRRKLLAGLSLIQGCDSTANTSEAFP